MGCVYRALDTRLDTVVALKEMTIEPEQDPTSLAQMHDQFRREARLLANLTHPNLVKVTDYFEWEGNAYLVMNLVVGTSLDQALASHGAFEESQVVAWTSQILHALIYCHGQGIIHRDIKPQNVVIRPDGQIVLVDFGLAKRWNPSNPHTQTVLRGMGTPEYAPPEQYDGSLSHTDARSDLYSLAATMYHALTGHAPPTATMRILNPQSLTPIRQDHPTVSQKTEGILMQALELQPNRRPPDALVMLSAFVTDSTPVSGNFPGKSRTAGQRLSLVWLFAGGLALLLAAFLLYSHLRDSWERPESNETVSAVSGSTVPPPTKTTPDSPVTPTVAVGLPQDTPALDRSTQAVEPAGTPQVVRIYFDSDRSGDWDIYSLEPDRAQEVPIVRMAASGQGDTACNSLTGRIAYDTNQDGNWEVYSADWTGANQRNHTQHPADDEEPAWSSDGRYLAFKSDRTGNWDIWILDLTTQEYHNLTNHPADDRHPSWSPDGQWVAFISDRSGNWDLYKVRTSGVDVIPLTTTSAEDRFPTWSPDGKQIVFHSRPQTNADSDIYVLDLESLETRRLTSHAGDDWGASWSPDGLQIAFVSVRDGNNEIYVMDRDGGNPTRLTYHPGSDTWPCWLIIP
ncbi:MAG: serine/threonine-protein kinase [Anaerolineae bacterium]|nr:serine/threonine-protein kinase [Anaerolineae bacterium]